MQAPSDQPPTTGATATDDPHRPQYHFLPPANWMNDPNGLIQWGRTYHLFYQYNPNGSFHSTIHWGHATSEDLVHWQHLPIALAPTPGSADADGCWSGCAVDYGGVPTLIYSGHRNGQQRPCLATSTDELLTWQKYPGNPVIPEPPPGLDLVAFRDHTIWREDGVWYQLIGAGIKGQGGAALLYRSADLRAWKYLHPVLVGDAQRTTPVWTGSMWECPDFFQLDGRHVLVTSIWEKGDPGEDDRLHYSVAFVGRYHERRFVPAVEHKLDHGDRYFYAPQSFCDRQGRRIVLGWVQEGRSREAQRVAGWSGMMSLPRELTLGPDGCVRMRPVRELVTLRAEHMLCAAMAVPAGQSVVLPEIVGDTLELLVELVLAPGGRCGLAVRRAPDGAEQTVILYDSATRQLIVDRERSSLNPDADRSLHVAPLSLPVGEPLRLQIFLDGSVLEVYANDQICITSRIYPTRPDSLGVALLVERQDAQLLRFDAWQMRSIWAGQRTDSNANNR
jgi:beta-fructofuranosidase